MSEPTPTSCAASLKLLGDFWTLRIIDSLQSDSLRFCELQRRVDNLNPVTLTGRLKKLESNGLIERTSHGNNAVTYGLTALGRRALPVVKAIEDFSSLLTF